MSDVEPTEEPESWWPEGYDLPAFRTKRPTYGATSGGDWVRGSAGTDEGEDLPHTALRYPSTTVEASDPTGTRAILFARPFDYHTVEILWGWPTKHPSWQEVALVRSSFGHPSTPRDGMTVFRALRGDPRLPEYTFNPNTSELDSIAPPLIYDMLLPSGHWYYYTMFFRTNPIDWVVAMSDGCALPNDYQHRERMWECVPPYYQWVDDSHRHHLQRFLSVFGFAMDNTRQFVEGVLDLHRIDKTPVPLLKGLGANYGLPYESGIGDIRYRGLVANAPNAQHTRGTAEGLRRLVEAVSKYQTEVSRSLTLMLYPDDSDFYLTTGNWGGLHPDAVAPIIAAEALLTSLPWDRIFLAQVDKAPQAGRGAMRVYTSKADETQTLIFAVGDSRIHQYPDPLVPGGQIPAETITLPHADALPPASALYRDALPVTTAITVTPGRPYGFSIWVQAPEKAAGANPAYSIELLMIWVGPSGEPQEVVEVSLGNLNPVSLDPAVWTQFIGQGIAPERTDTMPEAHYLIPAVRVTNRIPYTLTNRSAAIDVCGAMVYALGDEDTKLSITPPDRYLTLGDPAEQIGAPDVPGAPPEFEGSIIGSPQRGSQ